MQLNDFFYTFQSKMKKQQGHSLNEQKASAAKALAISCVICKAKKLYSLIVCLVILHNIIIICLKWGFLFTGANARPKNIQAAF